MPFMCSLLPNRKLIFAIHFSCEKMQWSRMTLLYKSMSFVCVSCKPVWRYALIFRIELNFDCGEETMVILNLQLISLIPGCTKRW